MSLISALRTVYYFLFKGLRGSIFLCLIKAMSYRSLSFLFSVLKTSILLRRLSGFVFYSNLNYLILKKLVKLGYISFFYIKKTNSKSVLVFFFLFSDNFILPIQGIKLLVSSNSKNLVLNFSKLRKLNTVSGIILISTKYGILTKSEALRFGVGGVPLLSLW